MKHLSAIDEKTKLRYNCKYCNIYNLAGEF